MNPIRILLVDDHAIVRAGFRALLGTLANIAVVGEAANGYEALGLMRQHRPDIALIDVAMPELNGLEVAIRARKANPHTRLVMLSMYDDEQYVRQALASGAAGFLLKQSSVSELELALHAVARGHLYFSPKVARGAESGNTPARPVSPGPFELLTSRQREILQLIGEGHTAKAIALRLSLSIKTVDTHRAQLMKRTRLNSMPELVCYAIRTGLARA